MSQIMQKKKKGNAIQLSDGTVVNSFILSILKKRGLRSEIEIKEFLDPKLADLPDPFLMLDMGKAVDILEGAIENGHEIIIWGDYDVDGTTAIAVLYQFLALTGHKEIKYYIPNRLQDGYGLNKKELKNLKNTAFPEQILVTVDNGIASFAEIEYAKELGFTCIVTDHHIPSESRVSADAVVNPKQDSCPFPDKNLAGVGLAFYLVIAVRSRLIKNGYFNKGRKVPNLKQLLDLVAIGTVADMVPLSGVNRILVKAGLESIASQNNFGISSLCYQTNVSPKHIRSEDISFQLGPKINAVGRLGNAGKAVELFLSENKKDAARLASEMIDANTRRKSKNTADLQIAINMIITEKMDQKSCLVVAGDFHVGVAGIVASNLTEDYGKPSVVLCRQDDGIFKGSARSIPGVNLYKVLEECSAFLLGFGGHKMAGGMSLNESELASFKNQFNSSVHKQSNGVVHIKKSEADCDMKISELFKREILEQLNLLEPFGETNPPLIIRDSCVHFEKISAVGEGKDHLRFIFRDGTEKINGIGFWLGKKIDLCREKRNKEMFYTLTVNSFRGKRTWEVRVIDVLAELQ